MPELPEVEHAARRLEAAAVGKRLAAVRTYHPAIRRALSDEDAAALAGRDVERVERRGKYQLLHLSDGLVLIAHFRMAGDWEIGEPSVPPRLARAVLEFTDGTAVYLTDGRAFATLVVRPSGAEALPPLGLDAASPEVDGAYLLAALAARRAPIKQALLDQAVLAGLGNIYAAEALWHAGLSPLVPAKELGRASLDRLAVAIHLTLALARDDPGRYSRGEGIERLSVYGREGEPCLRCGTAVARLAQAGRSTYWCPGCQRRPRAPRARVSRVPRAAPP